MTKQFKNERCVYCAGAAMGETGDHLFARAFFLSSQRSHLPKVPACNRCNGEKSKLEHYLAALLPFGGRQPDASINLTTMVPKRLAKNRRLHCELARRAEKVWTRQATGLYVRTTALPFDGKRLEELLAFVVKGLMWHHWHVLLAADSFVDVLSLTMRGERFFSRYSGMNAAQRVEISLGDGVVAYKGALGVDNPQVSIWEFSLFGGLKLADRDEADECVKFGAFTGPLRVKESADRKHRSGRYLVRV